MQGALWQMKNPTTISAYTFFTSQFFDFDNSSSRIEEGDISRQSIRNDFSDENEILKQLLEAKFLKFIEVYYRCKYVESFLQWREINQKWKRKEKLNPRSMTKIFLKVFYLINKKIRIKYEKSFILIVQFTKQHDMLTYQTPVTKALKLLNQSYQSLSTKYIYNHPIQSQQLVVECFNQLKKFSYLIKNQQKISLLIQLIEKMSNAVLIGIWLSKLNSLGRLRDKIEILEGSLVLLINPLRRTVFLKLKQVDKLFLVNVLQKQASLIMLQRKDSLIQGTGTNVKIDNNFIEEERFLKIEQKSADRLQQIPEKRSLDSEIPNVIRQNYFGEISQASNILSQASQSQNSLKFSKQLKRKPSMQKKNKLKFKNVSTPKKQPQQNLIKKVKDKQVQQISDQVRLHNDVKNLNVCSNNVSISSISTNMKSLNLSDSFEKSLNFAMKSSRKITLAEKVFHLFSIKSHQLSPSSPDIQQLEQPQILNFESLKKKVQLNLGKDDNKKSQKIFKTIKSGKSLTYLEDFPQNISSSKQFKNTASKLSVKFAYNEQTGNEGKVFEIPLVPNNSVLNESKEKSSRKFIVPFEKRPTEKQTQRSVNIGEINEFPNTKTGRIVNLKGMERINSNPSLYDFKSEYKFPISTRSNKNIELLIKPNNQSKQLPPEYESQYQTNPQQLKPQSIRIKPIQQPNSNKHTQTQRNASLTFKKNRPMKKVKSSDKEILHGTKTNFQNKKNTDKNMPRIKKNKQMRSEFSDSRDDYLNLNTHYSNYKMENITVSSVKEIRNCNSSGAKQFMKSLGIKALASKK